MGGLLRSDKTGKNEVPLRSVTCKSVLGLLVACIVKVHYGITIRMEKVSKNQNSNPPEQTRL